MTVTRRGLRWCRACRNWTRWRRMGRSLSCSACVRRWAEGPGDVEIVAPARSCEAVSSARGGRGLQSSATGPAHTQRSAGSGALRGEIPDHDGRELAAGAGGEAPIRERLYRDAASATDT